MNIDYSVTTGYDDSLFEQFSKVYLSAGLSAGSDSRIFAWKHRDNPLGPSIISYAVDSATDRIVAVRALMRADLTVRGERIIAFQPCDTATHPDYQRRGLFSKLTMLAAERAREEGASVLYNFPNYRSGPGYLKLGWQPEPSMKMVGKPINRAFCAAEWLLRKVKKSRREAECELDQPARLFPAKTQELIRACLESRDKSAGEIAGYRDLNWLRWRFETNPAKTYRIIVAGCLIALVCVWDHRIMKEARIVDLWTADRKFDNSMFALLQRNLSSAIRPHLVSCYITEGHWAYRAFQNAGFRDLPSSIGMVRFVLDETSSFFSADATWSLIGADIDTQ